MSAASAKAPVVIVRVGPSGSPERRRRQPSFTSSPPTTPTFTAGTANGSTVFGENELLPGLSEPLLPPRAYTPDQAKDQLSSSSLTTRSSGSMGNLGRLLLIACAVLGLLWILVEVAGHRTEEVASKTPTSTKRTERGEAPLAPPESVLLSAEAAGGASWRRELRLRLLPSTTAALAALSTVGDGGSATPRDNNAALMRALTGQVGGSGCRGALVRKEDALLRGHLTCGKTSSPPSVSGGAGGSVAQSSGGATISGRLGKVLAAAGGGATSWGTYYRRGTLAWVDSASPQIVLFTSTMSRGALLKQNENLASVMPFAEVIDDDGNPDAWASLDALSSLPGERSDGRLGALKPTLRLALSAPVARGK